MRRGGSYDGRMAIPHRSRVALLPLSVATGLALLPLAPACATSPGPEGAALAPEPLRISQDVRWLADDARSGRRAGTGGEEESARWLAQRLEALGLAPAGTEGFLQPFEVPLPVEDRGGSRIEARAEDQRVVVEGPGLVPLFCSSGGEAAGPLVFAGYGIADASLGRDDYAGLDVEGAIVMLVRGTPPDALLPKAAADETALENPHGAATPTVSGWGGAGALFQKIMEAKRRGARAVIVAQPPGHDDELLAFGEGGGAEARIPAFNVTALRAEELLPGYAERVARLDAGETSATGAARAASVVADVERERGSARNVLARVAGANPSRVVVIGAHFDHLGHGGPGSLAGVEQQGEVHNGADDNASGTAVVLELARILASGPQPACDVVLALWSGEELGLLGSEHWARNPTVPLDSVVANVNLDMVGRAESGKLAVLGAGSAREFSTLLATAGPRSGLELEVSLSGQGVGGSDHQTFLAREIPALHFFTGLHADYHRPSDDHERFEADGAARVTALVLDVLDDLCAAPELAFVAPPRSAAGATPGGFKTRLGTLPDYAFDGVGLRITGTSPGGPAEKAGLLGGDVILSLGVVEIEGMAEYMYALNAHKPGDVVTVRYLRDGVEETCQVTLESSQVE
jgi:hypothetical protein